MTQQDINRVFDIYLRQNPFEDGIKVYPFYFLDMPTNEAEDVSGGRPFLNKFQEREWRIDAFLTNVNMKYSYLVCNYMHIIILSWAEDHPNLIGYEYMLRRMLNIYLHRYKCT